MSPSTQKSSEKQPDELMERLHNERLFSKKLALLGKMAVAGFMATAEGNPTQVRQAEIVRNIEERGERSQKARAETKSRLEDKFSLSENYKSNKKDEQLSLSETAYEIRKMGKQLAQDLVAKDMKPDIKYNYLKTRGELYKNKFGKTISKSVAWQSKVSGTGWQILAPDNERYIQAGLLLTKDGELLLFNGNINNKGKEVGPQNIIRPVTDETLALDDWELKNGKKVELSVDNDYLKYGISPTAEMLSWQEILHPAEGS